MSPHVLACPRCATVAPSPGRQACVSCSLRLALYLGPLVDASRIPAPAGPRIQVKSPGTLRMRFGTLDQLGVAEGPLDPVLGGIPMDVNGVWWGDIASIAVWRTIAWRDVVTAVAILPIVLGLGYLGLQAALGNARGDGETVLVFLFLAVWFALISAFHLWRALILRACHARIIGRARTITVRFDRPIWRGRQFHDELLRRAGLDPAELP